LRGSQALYTRHQADPEADCLLQIRRRRHGRICEEGKDLWDWVINPIEVVITYPRLLGGQGFVGLGDKSHRGYNNLSQLTSVQSFDVLEKFVVEVKLLEGLLLEDVV
jgi:hypothetical protein